ncbi:MAG: MarR family transcriptional regulator [Akkermansia sp.]|nr:MarR family transcriptional regulator [Akkermansia sp.]
MSGILYYSIRHAFSLLMHRRDPAPVEDGKAEEIQTLADFVLFSQRSCMLRLSSKLVRAKVSYPQFSLLAYLTDGNSLSMSSIARIMGHSTAATTGMVDKLQELGYLTRSTASSDRRKVMVRATRSGAAFVDKIRSAIAEDLAALMELPDEERRLSSAARAVRKALPRS